MVVKPGTEFDLHLSVGFIRAGDQQRITQPPEPEGHRIDRFIAERRLEPLPPRRFLSFCNRVAAIGARRIDRFQHRLALQRHDRTLLSQRRTARPVGRIEWTVLPGGQVGAGSDHPGIHKARR
ncbi:MAG: hypothetical protein C0183_14100, partial [Roseiflexus castenholzii]